MTESDARRILEEPYKWEFIYDQGEKSWFGKIAEFKGCFNDGETFEVCYQRLVETAVSWILSADRLGQTIPYPEVMP
jgi:predicted RNase H-like HicB family nuclease